MSEATTPTESAGDDVIFLDIDSVLDLTRDEPLFSKARFERVLPEFDRVKTNGGTFTITNLLGQEATATWGPELLANCGDMTPQILLAYMSYQTLAEKDLERENVCIEFPPIGIGLVSGFAHDCSEFDQLEARLQEQKEAWENSQFRQKLILFLEEHGDKTVPVKQIVCFGLGFLTREDTTRCYTQHLAACTIRDTLRQVQAGQAGQQDETTALPEIQVYAQDPDYCKTCTTILEERHDIRILEDPHGFLKIDRNTFVVSVSPDVPVRQIVTDISLEYGGPAGILCNEIESDGMEFNQQECRIDDFVDGYSRSTDPSSPNVAAYRDRCIALKLDEAPSESVFGSLGLYLKPR